jgi:hypothetical protein
MTGAGGITAVGFNSNFPQGRIQETYQFQDTVSWTRGRNTIRVGGDIGRQIAKILVPQNEKGTLTFNTGGTGNGSVGNFLLNQLGRSGTAVRTSGPHRFDPHSWRIGASFQDDLKLSPDLTINVGMRYDYFTPIENSLSYPAIDPSNLYGPIATYVPVTADKNNIAPRIGFSFSPHESGRLLGNGKTVIRGAFGVFYDSDFSNLAYNSANTAPNSASTTLTSTTANGLPNATGLLSLITPNLTQRSTVSLSVVKNLVSPYTYEYNFGVERSLPGDWVATMTYVGSRGLKLYANQQFNYINPATGLRLNPSRGIINARGNFADSQYHGLETSIEHRFHHGFLVRGTYTYSKALDDGSEVFAADAEATSYTADLSLGGRRQDWGNSAYDHRHWASITYVWSPAGIRSSALLRALTGGWIISGVSQFQSGGYGTFNVSGLDLNGDGSAANDRPILGNPRAPISTAGIDGTWVTDANGKPGTPGVYYDLTVNNGPTSALVPVNPSQVHWLVQAGQQYLQQEIGRNSYKNPYQQFHNVAVEKGFSLGFAHFERGNFVIRAEAQDIANHNNIGPLNTNVLNIGTTDYLNKHNAIVSNPADGRVLRLWGKVTF